MSSSFNIVAIDGGAATGKSSTSSAIAKAWATSTSTGAHYRTVTFLSEIWHQSKGPRRVENTLETIGLGTSITAQQAFLTVNGCRPHDTEIRSPEVNAVVAHFAAIASIRKFLFDYQRNRRLRRTMGFRTQ